MRKKLFIEQMDAAELSPGEFSHRVRSCVDAEAYQHRRDRQPQRLSGRDAGGTVSDPASARTAAVSQPPAARRHFSRWRSTA